MPDKFGNLVNVVTDDDPDNQAVLPDLPDFVAQATNIIETNEINQQRGFELIQNTQVSMAQDIAAQRQITADIEGIYDKLSQDRWIDFVFGPEARELVGLFDKDYSDSYLQTELLRKQQQAAAKKDAITNKQNVITTARGIIKDAALQARQAASDKRAARKAQTSEMKSVVENADFEQLQLMATDPRFVNYRGLIADEMQAQAESYVASLPEMQVLRLAKDSKNPVIKAAAEESQHEIIGLRLDNRAREELIKQRQLGNVKQAEEITKFRRENVLDRASATTLRQALNEAQNGYGKIGDQEFARGDLQAALTLRMEQKNKLKGKEIEYFDAKFDTSRYVMQGDVILTSTQQGDIQLPEQDIAAFNRFKAMAGNEQLMNTHGKQIMEKGKEIIGQLIKDRDDAVKKLYPSKTGQAAAHDFLDNGRVDNAQNAAYMLSINSQSPTMGAREGGVLANSMSLLQSHLQTTIDASFINNGEVDLEALIKDTKFKPEDMMANYIQESGARTRAMADIYKGYFFDSIKRFEKENQQAAGTDATHVNAQGKKEINSSAYLLNLYKITGDDSLVKKFLASHGDQEAQRAWADTLKSNLNMQEAAALKLFTENRVQNILVKQHLMMDNPQKAAVVRDRYTQDTAQQRDTQERNIGYLTRIREGIDRLAESGLDEKYIEKRIQEQARAFNFSDSAKMGLRSYIRLKLQALSVADNPTEQSMIMDEAETAWQATTRGLTPNTDRL